MSDITFSCPACKQSLEAPAELAGQLTDCPTCSSAIEIPVIVHQRLVSVPPPQPPSLTAPPPRIPTAPAAQPKRERRHGIFYYVFWGTLSLIGTITILVVGFFFLSAFGIGFFGAFKKDAARSTAASHPVPMMPALTEAEKQEAQTFLHVLNAQRDSIEGITWYSPDNGYKTATYFYIGKKDTGDPWLRWEIRYYGDKWLFIRRYRIKLDEAEAITLSPSGDLKHKTGSGSVWEIFDESAREHAHLINQVLSSRSVYLRMEGTEGVKDLNLASNDLQQMRDILLVYRYLGGEWPAD